jgi:hypothetical protein
MNVPEIHHSILTWRGILAGVVFLWCVALFEIFAIRVLDILTEDRHG